MRKMIKPLMLACLLAASQAAALTAQTIRYESRTGGYALLGFGGGNFTLTCDSVCPGNQLGASNASLMLGRHLGNRLRAEIGFNYQSNREYASNLFSAQLGAAVYLINNLYVRGGVSYHRVSVEDTAGTFEGSGGPGFSVGAGYDLHLGRTFALTPFVNYASGSLSKIDIARFAGAGTTAGSVRSLNFGISASFIRGTWWCVNRQGQSIKVIPRNRVTARMCLAEVEQRLGRSSGVKG